MGTPDVLAHSIILSHWGLLGPENPCKAHHWMKPGGYEACRQIHSSPERGWQPALLQSHQGGNLAGTISVSSPGAESALPLNTCH